MTGKMFDFAHFIEAQDRVYDRVLAELTAGRKESHWMWFVFPQAAGLSRSAMGQRFALASVDEAEAYARDPIAGGRLLECASAALSHAERRSAHDVFGAPDDQKFHASMTLFAIAAPSNGVFVAALEGFFGGARHTQTERLLAGATPQPPERP